MAGRIFTTAAAAKGLGIVVAMTMAASGLAVSGASAAESEGDGSEKEKKICRTTKMTGSLTRRTRICMTEAEWRELANRTRKGLEEMGQNASGAPSCCASALLGNAAHSTHWSSQVAAWLSRRSSSSLSRCPRSKRMPLTRSN